MIEHIIKCVFALSVTMFLLGTSVQSQDSPECYGRVYGVKDVTRRARITRSPDLNLIDVFAHGQKSHVVMRGVLCRTGQVTNIQLIEGTPSELTEYLKKAVASVSFTPAELNWHSVSQRMAFEFKVNGGDTKMISEAEAKGRLVERLEIVGSRRLTPEQIMSWIKTKPGDPYDGDQVQRDLQTMLAKGYFDKLQTRVITEDGPRGGIAVTFEVAELPVISDVKINGVSDGYRLRLWSALTLVGVGQGEPFDVTRVKLATFTIKQFLESKGWRDVQVQETTENVSASEVILTFVINGNKPQ
jgi:surface antigen-like variable number repeat protein